MGNTLKLVKAEFNRLNKYGIIKMSAGLAFVWALILLISTSKEEVVYMYPLLMFVDLAMMSVMLIGASLFFEKNEGTLKALMVSPIDENELLASKIITSTILSLISFTVVTIAFIFKMGGDFTGFDISYTIFPILFVFCIIIGLFNSFLGLTLSIFSNSFNSIMMKYMYYTILGTFPSLIITTLGVEFPMQDYILLLLPGECINNLLGIFNNSSIDYLVLILSIAILFTYTYLLRKYIVKPKFREYAIRG